MVAVRDVAASSRWYATVLGAQVGVCHAAYGQILSEGDLVLQLHRRDMADRHDFLADPEVPPGHGVAVWFRIDDFDSALDRIEQLEARIELGPRENTNAGQQEVWLTDPDGYRVVLAGPPAREPASR